MADQSEPVKPDECKKTAVSTGDKKTPFSESGLLFVRTIACLVLLSLIFNLITGVAAETLHWLFLTSFFLILGLYFLGCRYGRVTLMTNGILMLICFVLLPANWFFNGGSQGPTMIWFLVALTYGHAIHSPGNSIRLGLVCLLLLTPPLLFVVEYWFPELIYRYASDMDRLMDMMVTFLLCGAALIILITGVTRRFHRELARADALATELRELSVRDGQTLLLNHAAILDLAQNRIDRNLSVILYLLDLDHFKQINDEYGYLAGDKVLGRLAECLERVALSMGGEAGRIGGGEFLVVLTGGMQQVMKLENDLRQSLTPHPEVDCPITYSTGIALSNAEENIENVLCRAGDALQKAKVRGRNKSVLAESGRLLCRDRCRLNVLKP